MGRITSLVLEDMTLTTAVDVLAAFQTGAVNSAGDNVFIKRLEITQNGSTTLSMVRGQIATRNTAGTLTTTAQSPTNVRPAGGAASALVGNTSVIGGAARSGTNATVDTGGAYTELWAFDFANTVGYLFKPDPEEEIWIPASTVCVIRFKADPAALTHWTIAMLLKEEG